MITVGIPTKNRYDYLSHTLLSIALQTLKPQEVIIVDDSDFPEDLRTFPIYKYIFKLFDEFNIEWKILFGVKKGQHFSHQLVQEEAKGNYIFRIDDDCIAESNVLELLYHYTANKNVAAIGPSVLMENAHKRPSNLTNSIAKIKQQPNAQWFKDSGLSPAEHLYSCFLYKKGIANYDLSLSTVAHREETIFTYSMHHKGYNLLIKHDAIVRHFKSSTGGIRSFHDTTLWENDEKIFNSYLNLWDVLDTKVVVLNNGLGDHYSFKNILPDLKAKYKDITIACCYPDVFHDEKNLNLISIADAIKMYNNIECYNIYKFMADNNWKDTLINAYKKLYGI